jgi:creatinine amidohydrolase
MLTENPQFSRLKVFCVVLAGLLLLPLSAAAQQSQKKGEPMKKSYEPDRVKEDIPSEPIPQEVRAQFLRPGEVLAIQQKFPVAFQPVGTLEWHGRQNPIGCDTIKAERLVIETAKKIGGVVMPPIYFASDAYRDVGKGYGLGMDPEAGFQLPGSFYQIETGLLKQFMLNACHNYLARGFKLVVIVSGHNPSIQQNLFDEICYLLKTEDGKEPVFFSMEYTAIPEGHPKRSGDHAGGYETSMMLFLNGDRVNLKANEGQKEPDLAIYNEFPVNQATAAEGELRFNLQVEGLAHLVQERLKRLL